MRVNRAILGKDVTFSEAYRLLEEGNRSSIYRRAWHKVDADEIWHHYAVAPLELALSEDGRKRRGNVKWQASVHDAVARLKAAMIADYVVLGGGNAKRLTELPPGCRLGHNNNAFIGGARLWEN